MNAHLSSALYLLFIRLKTQPMKKVPLTFMVDPSTSIIPIKKCPHKYAYSLSSYSQSYIEILLIVSLDCVKLIIKANLHNLTLYQSQTSS